MALEDAARDIDGAITRQSLKGLSYENAFSGIMSFLRRRYTKDLGGVDLAVTGIPFDQAVTNRPGARFGPRAIREASTLLPCDAPYGWNFNPLEENTIIDFGDLAYDYARVADFPQILTEHIRTILAAGTGSLALGGDHSITYPILKAYAEIYGPLRLLQFDAHTDTWEDGDPKRIDHGTMIRKAINDHLIIPEHSVQIGIRTHNPDTMGVNIIDAPALDAIGTQAALSQVKEILGHGPVYLSFDIDALDPAFAPGTGTPVPGGLSTSTALSVLRGLAGINMVGGDIVEVAPPYDTTGATAIAGAQLALELACLYCRAKNDQRQNTK